MTVIILLVSLCVSLALCVRYWLKVQSLRSECLDNMTMLLVLRAHHAECMDEYDTMLSDHKAYIDVCHKSIAHLRGECAVLTSERDRYVVMSSDMLRAIGGSTTEREALLTELRNN